MALNVTFQNEKCGKWICSAEGHAELSPLQGRGLKTNRETMALLRATSIKLTLGARRSSGFSAGWDTTRRLSLRSHGCCVLAQRGGSCAIVLTENMFFSSCVTERRLKCLWVPFFFSPRLTPPLPSPSCCTSPGTHVREVPLSMWPSWVLFVRK